jgi:predicted XRE-type DNA-binding protein
MTANDENESEKNERTFVHIAVTEDEKRKWKEATGKGKRFTTMTALVKYCVEGYLNGVLIEKPTKKKGKSKKTTTLENELKSINKKIKDIEEQNKELFDELKEERDQLKETVEVADKQEIKERIFTILKKGKFTADELAKALQVPKPKVLTVLNAMEIKEKWSLDTLRNLYLTRASIFF